MPSDEEIREQILRPMIDSFRDQNGLVVIRVGSIVEEAEERLTDVSDDDIRYQMRRLSDEGYIDLSGSSDDGVVKLHSQGIDEYERLSGDIVISEDYKDEIIEILYIEERNDPSNPSVLRDEIINQISFTEDELDRAVWYLKRMYMIDVHTHPGQPWWHSAKITDEGRRMHESP